MCGVHSNILHALILTCHLSFVETFLNILSLSLSPWAHYNVRRPLLFLYITPPPTARPSPPVINRLRNAAVQPTPGLHLRQVLSSGWWCYCCCFWWWRWSGTTSHYHYYYCYSLLLTIIFVIIIINYYYWLLLLSSLSLVVEWNSEVYWCVPWKDDAVLIIKT